MKTLEKTYFSNDIDHVIEQISFDSDNVELMGTASKKGMLYPADFDLYEIVSRSSVVKSIRIFKKIVKRVINNPYMYIADIKCGEAKEWVVVDEKARIDTSGKIRNYDYKSILNKIITLKKQKVITKQEYDYAISILKKNPNRIELETIKKDLRFHILRWKPKDILNGFLIFRGKKFYFKDAIVSPALFKMDVIALVLTDMRFVEFNIIYDIRVDNNRKNIKTINPEHTLTSDILYYKDKKDYFKMLKRYFSLINFKIKYKNQNTKHNKELYEKMFEILNSDLGILYQVTQDIETIIILLDDNMYSGKKIDLIIDGFIDRLSNIYSLNSFLEKEDDIMSDIYKNVKNPNSSQLKELNTKLYDLLSKNTEIILSKYSISYE